MSTHRIIKNILESYIYEPAGKDKTPVIANLSNNILVLQEPPKHEWISVLDEIWRTRIAARYINAKDRGYLFNIRSRTLSYISITGLMSEGIEASVDLSSKINWQKKVIKFLDNRPLLDLPRFIRLPFPEQQVYERLKKLSFEAFLDSLVCPQTSISANRTSLISGFSSRVLMEMYAHRWVLLPPSLVIDEAYKYANIKRPTFLSICERAGVDKEFINLVFTPTNPKISRHRRVGRILIFSTTIKKANDFSQAIVDDLLATVSEKISRYDRYRFNNVIQVYINKNLDAFSGNPPLIRGDSPEMRAKRIDRFANAKVNGTFQWAVRANPLLETWASIFRNYAQHQNQLVDFKDLSVRLNCFLEFLLHYATQQGDLALTEILRPEQLVRLKHIAPPKLEPRGNGLYFLEWLEGKYSAGKSSAEQFNRCLVGLQGFFAWYAEEYNKPDLQYLISTQHDSLRENGRNAQTHRNSIPPKIYNKMREILIRDDYAWAKTLDEDYFHSETAGRVWSPCRAIALRFMLTIPVRHDSLESADTGQADHYIYNPGTGSFILNSRSCAENNRSLGILRQFSDSSGKIIGFYFTNDKTNNNGIEVKWDNLELRNEIVKLIEFNELHGGPAQLCHRSHIKSIAHAAIERYPDFYPVFRDLGNRRVLHRQTPVSDGRINRMLLSLLDETEKELNEGLSLGEPPITLITERWGENNYSHRRVGAPKTGIIDLHGLRVTGISLFALAGLPVTIIAEFLAGHMSILMDLYYWKLGVSTITAAIDKAFNNVQNNINLSSLNMFKNDQIISRELLGAAVTADALDGFAQSQPGFWSASRGFICPNGGALCEEGNLASWRKGSVLAHPIVEGGKGNCPLCRFAIAGPMTLTEQVLALQSFAGELFDHHQKRAQIQHDLDVAYSTTQRQAARQLEAEVENLDRRSETLAKIFVARVHWIQSSISANTSYERVMELMEDGSSSEEIKRELLSSDGKISQHELLTMGDVEDIRLSIRHASNEELILTLATIGHISKINRVPSMDARLIRLIDSTLQRHGIRPFLFALDEESATAAAVKMSYLISSYYRRVTNSAIDPTGGRAQVAELLRGDRSLQKDDPSGQLLEALRELGNESQSRDWLKPLHLEEVFKEENMLSSIKAAKCKKRQ